MEHFAVPGPRRTTFAAMDCYRVAVVCREKSTFVANASESRLVSACFSGAHEHPPASTAERRPSSRRASRCPRRHTHKRLSTSATPPFRTAGPS